MHSTTQPPWVALVRELDSVSVDPLSHRELRLHRLPAGVLVENPWSALAAAERAGDAEVTVRTHDGYGWFGLERVSAAALRAALPPQLLAPSHRPPNSGAAGAAS